MRFSINLFMLAIHGGQSLQYPLTKTSAYQSVGESNRFLSSTQWSRVGAKLHGHRHLGDFVITEDTEVIQGESKESLGRNPTLSVDGLRYSVGTQPAQSNWRSGVWVNKCAIYEKLSGKWVNIKTFDSYLGTCRMSGNGKFVLQYNKISQEISGEWQDLAIKEGSISSNTFTQTTHNSWFQADATAITHDGSRFVVGRKDSGTDNIGSLVVYDYVPESSTYLASGILKANSDDVGNDILARTNIKISNDGNRILAADYVTGIAYIFNWNVNEQKWTQTSIDGRTSPDVGRFYFGWNKDFSSDGNRAIFCTGSHTEIYDYNGSSWNRVYNNPSILPSLSDTFVCEISPDGNRFVVGFSAGTRVMKVYDLATNGFDWEERGSFYNNNYGGVQAATGHFADYHGTMLAIAMTEGGYEYRGINYFVNLSTSTRAATTNNPTTAPITSSPTTLNDDFINQNFNISTPTITFSNQNISDYFTLDLSYQHGSSIYLLETILMYENCTTDIIKEEVIQWGEVVDSDPKIPSLFSYKSNNATTDKSSNIFNATIFVSKKHLAGSPLTTLTNNGTSGASAGVLSFCVKIESFFEIGSDVSVSFQKQRISLAYDLTQNEFSVKNNVIKENTITLEEETVSTQYTVKAFRCNRTSYEKKEGPSPTLTQNQVIFICIKPGEADVEISNFQMKFKRNASDESAIFTAVDYGEGSAVGHSPTSLSTITNDATGTYRVVSRLITDLFAEGADSFDVVGNAYLAFKATRSRHLNSINTPSLRAVQDSAGNAPFKLGVMIEKGNVVPQAQSNLSAVTVLSVIGGLIILSILFVKKMKQ